MVKYSLLGNADGPEVDNMPVDKVAQSRKENLAPNKAYRTKGEHSPSDADQTRGQGFTTENSALQASTIRVVTATDSHAWLAGEKSRQPAQLTDENRNTSARKAGDQDTMPLPCRKEENTNDIIYGIYKIFNIISKQQ